MSNALLLLVVVASLALAEALYHALRWIGERRQAPLRARSLAAGHALPAALRLVAREMPPPVAVEFAKAFEEQNLGVPLDQAVMGMTRRVPGNADLAIFAVSVNVQRETGGNLVEMLEKLA